MKKKILLVEYAATSIDIIKEILSPPIFEITVASEGDTAKEYLAEKSFDLMITAAMLPKFHGFNLSQYAAENYPAMKIIIISEIYKGMDYKHQATTLYKANDFFEKPFDKQVFKDRVFELLEIDTEDVEKSSKKTTTRAPFSDTKKIPTLKKIKEEGKKLTSEDLFGDIIEKVHEIPSYEIKLDEEEDKSKQKEKPGSAAVPEVPPVTREFAPPVTQQIDRKMPAGTQVLKTPSGDKTQKIDLDFLDLIKSEKKDKTKHKDIRNKKIEEDISRKLEDTLSGLGIGDKSSPPKGAAPETSPKTKVIKSAKTPETTSDEKETPDEVSGYEILGLIGRGGMAEIYKAKKKGVKGFEKIIALKKILSGYGTDAKYIEMFVDEAKIAAELSHPNIVQIHDLGKKDDYYFIAMEYVSGKDLRVIMQKLAQESTLMPEPIAIYLAIEVLSALNYAHTARDSSGKALDIVHRDISPPNILVSYAGNIKLTDFGVSKASIKMHQTLAGALKGKLLYMSPEQAKGEDHIDYRSDLYSVGIILFELITGKKLFLNSSEMGTLKKVQQGVIIKPSHFKKDIDPELETIILKALNKQMNRRYQAAAHMVKDLETYMKNHYNAMPESTHVGHFITNLFKKEIKAENIEINLPPLPYAVTKKIKKEVKAKEEVQEDTIPELPEADLLEESRPGREEKDEKTKEKKLEQELIRGEEFQPIIEITFDEDQKKKDIPAAEERAIFSGFEALTPKKEVKKKTKFLMAGIIVIVVLAMAIVLYLVLASGESGSGPPPAAGVTDNKQPQEQQLPTAAVSDSDSQSQDQVQVEKETPDPDAHDTDKGDKPGKIEQQKEKETSESTQISTLPQTLAEEKITPDQPEKTKKKRTSKKAHAEEGQPEETPAPQQDKPKTPEEKTEPEEMQKPGPQPVTEEPAPEVETPAVEEKKASDLQEEEIVKPGDILSPSIVDTQPIPVSTPKIKITRSIRRLMMSDQRLLVSYLVDHNGNIETVKLLKKSSLQRLNNLIIETIRKWKYKPATKNNIKVKVWKNKWILITK
ncbi:MAG: protein kinase [Candidatus Aminicenantes bacterium]|jgi:serine/threonine protein kinase/DNA-binding response OmpR family regulator